MNNLVSQIEATMDYLECHCDSSEITKAEKHLEKALGELELIILNSNYNKKQKVKR
jgi:hypothetical protein